MQKDYQIAVFEGGELHVVRAGSPGREAVLALPLSRLLAKMVRVAAGEDPVAAATPVLQAMSPFPDEPLTVSCETVRTRDDGSSVVLAAALPESATDDIAEALDAQKLSVTRVDLLALGELREAWGRFDATDGRRRLIRLKSADCLTLFVLDGDQPVAIRGLADVEDQPREEMLLLLEAESFGGAKPLAETIDVESSEATRAAAVEGLVERAEDPNTLNALPQTWREVLDESRFKAKMIRYVAVAVGLWAVVMAVLLGVPVAYGFMTDYQKSLSKDHARQYRQVNEKKKKVEVFQTYSDHARGALEIMKAVSDRLPAGITLTSWSYDRATSLRVSGEAETDAEVYDFKNKMEALSFGETDENGDPVDPDAERVFTSVELGRLNLGKGGLQRFDLEMSFESKEDEE